MILPIKGMKSARPADIKGGNLVVCKWAEKFQYAIAVFAALPTQPRGLLLLEAKPRPVCECPTTGYCLDLGEPIFDWRFADGSISDSTRQSPAAGDLVVSGGATRICGMGFDKDLHQTVCAWDLATGKMSDVDLASAIYLKNWSLGVRDASGNFQRLFPRVDLEPGGQRSS